MLDSVLPDEKTKRYDRQLRLWANSGQTALESSRILMLSSSATSTSILKNLVLPGIGHFTILDSTVVSGSDAGNNFFLEGSKSIGKFRAAEAVRLLAELNEGVDGVANTSELSDVLSQNPEFFLTFDAIIAHNIPSNLLQQVADLLWAAPSPPPLFVVRSSGFYADISVQFRGHIVLNSHSDTAPSLRVDKPFPSLQMYAENLNLDTLDDTDHGHVPYIIILVKAMQEWKKSHDGTFPKTSQEKADFKKALISMKRKSDEENFDEAVQQAYRAWTETMVPEEISILFQDPEYINRSSSSPPFFHLLAALEQFTLRPPYTLPLTSALPDMKADTVSYIHLQKLYKAQADEDKQIFISLMRDGIEIPVPVVDDFVKNCNAIRHLKGTRLAALDDATLPNPKHTAIHASLSALSVWQPTQPGQGPTIPELRSLLKESSNDSEVSDYTPDVLSEVTRAGLSDLPATAALLGGLVAQEVIKMITKQYLPLQKVCVIDLIESVTSTAL